MIVCFNELFAAENVFGVGHSLSPNPVAVNWSSLTELRLIDGLASHGLAWDSVSNTVAIMSATECEKHFYQAILPSLVDGFVPSDYNYDNTPVADNSLGKTRSAPPACLIGRDLSESLVRDAINISF